MPDQFSIDPDKVQSVAASVGSMSAQFAADLQTWRSTLRQHDGCWGSDMQNQFGTSFTQSEQTADGLADPTNTAFTQIQKTLGQAGNEFVNVDADNARSVNSLDQKPDGY